MYRSWLGVLLKIHARICAFMLSISFRTIVSHNSQNKKISNGQIYCTMKVWKSRRFCYIIPSFVVFFFRIYLFLYERILKWLIMIAISYNVILTFLSYVIYNVDSKIFNSTALFVSFRHPFKIFLQNVTFY